MFAHAPWLPSPGRRLRASSFDRSGGNADSVPLAAGERRTIFAHQGPGLVQRLWLTIDTPDPDWLRTLRLRFSFDGEDGQDIPCGMLAATGPWRVNDLRSPPVNVMRARRMNQDQDGIGAGSINLAWPMPFNRSAVIEMVNAGTVPAPHAFFYVDHLVDVPEQAGLMTLRFTHRRENPTTPSAAGGLADPDRPGAQMVDGEAKNLSDRGNYVFADIAGHRGTYVGTVLAVESHPDRPGKWYEGDDMFRIDDDASWPPALHGTGTEDYFGMAWGLHRPYQADDHGVTHYERGITDHDRFYDGRFALYRWHLADPIPFRRSLRASIEAGHANDCAQAYESLAVWYGARA